jgi:methyl-accepting chemotaxis protein
MRLSVRWQLVSVLVTLSLVPMAVTGVAAYRSARGALDQSIRFNLETLASQTEERLEQLLIDRQSSLRGWSELRLIQDDAVTADADGRVLQFLQDAKRNFDLQELWVASAAGQVIASTIPGMRGREVGDRPWLQAARRGEGWVGVPQMQEFTDRVGMPIAMPLYASFDRSKIVGVIVEVVDWPKVVETLQRVKVLPEGQNDRGYLLLADSRGLLLSAPAFVGGWEAGKTRLSTLGLDGLEQVVAQRRTGSSTIQVGDSSFLLGFASNDPQPHLPGIWHVVLLLRTDVAFAPLGSLMWTILILSVVLAATAAGAAIYWANAFSRPIQALVPFLRSVAAGDLSGGFSSKRHDELGMLAQAANDMSGQLRGLILELQQAGFQITQASTQVLANAEDHASGSVQQAASISEVTATLEELTNTAKQIALSATSVEKIADDSAQAAHAGYASVGEALQAMENIRRRVADISGKTLLLGERSQRISEVLNLIKDIAGEIHLLAVNAAIESAAAGEHGKRFAVVASEVRRLAERTRESAEEIKGIVVEIQSATHSSVMATEQGVKEVENGVSLATGARGSLEQIIQMVDRTTQAIRQITLATQQQQSASEQIVQTMREVAVVTTQSASSMKQSAASVGELNVLADQFKTRIKEFKL